MVTVMAPGGAAFGFSRRQDARNGKILGAESGRYEMNRV